MASPAQRGNRQEHFRDPAVGVAGLLRSGRPVVTAMDALGRARCAWERSQPQLTIDGWADMLDGLDAADAGAVRCVEPAHTNRAGSGGLAIGDGERPESPSGPTRPLYNINGHDALPSESARRGRKEATP